MLEISFLTMLVVRVRHVSLVRKNMHAIKRVIFTFSLLLKQRPNLKFLSTESDKARLDCPVTLKLAALNVLSCSTYPLYLYYLWDNSLTSPNMLSCSLPFHAVAGFSLIQQKIHERIAIII